MRYAVFILAFLSVLAIGFIAFKWTTDVLEHKEMVDALRPLIALDPKAATEVVEFDRRTRLWPVLWGSALLGLAGGVLALMRRGLIAACLLLVAVVVPAVFDPRLLIFTFLFPVAAILSFFVRRRVPA